MIRNAVLGLMSLALWGYLGGWALGEEQGAAELYGRSVHAYNSGDLSTAMDLLTQLIDNRKSVDPRAYYFRGLVRAGLGDVQGATTDYARGADLEIHGERKYDVATALQRIQGQQRMAIERERAAARRSAVVKKKKRDQVRYEQLRRREDQVLYDPNRPAPDRSQLEIPAPAQTDENCPFASGMVLTGGQPIQLAEPAAPAAEDAEQKPRDPFATEPAEKPQPEDPFGSGDKKEAEAENPFGEAMPAEQEKAEQDPIGENPFGEAMPQAEEDPFGDLPDAAAGGAPPQAAAPGAAAPSAGGALGTIFRLLGDTFSEQPSDRNPFTDDEVADGPPAEAAPTQEPPAEAPAEPPAEEPAKDGGADDNPFK